MNEIRLVIADVDGTLLTPDEELTARARRAGLALGAADADSMVRTRRKFATGSGATHDR